MMRTRTQRLVLSAVLASVGVAAGLAWVVATSLRPLRAFMPGPLGSARGGYRAAAAGGEAGYQTRSIGLRPGEEQEWGRQNGITEGISFSHHLDRVFPPSLYATHPEYFPLVDGRRLQPRAGSASWNPDLGREDVARHAAEQAAAYFREHPEQVSYSLGENDAVVFGESPETLARVTPTRWFRERPDYSPLVFTFMNRAAQELARTHPNKYLGCLAYYWAENVPPFAVDSQVIPFLTSDRAQNYDPAFRREEYDLQNRWAAVLNIPGRGSPAAPVADGRRRPDGRPLAGRPAEKAPAGGAESPLSAQGAPPPRLGLYDYLDGYGFLVPRVPVHAFAAHIQHAYRAGFTDYYGESSRNWGLDGPLPWVIAQMLLDPEQNVEALLDEYYAGYFQGAAAPMRRFFERCEEQWMTQTGPSYWLKYYRNEAQAVLFPSAVGAELHKLLEAAAARAGSGEVRQRVAFVADAFGVTRRFVAFQEARSALAEHIVRNDLRGESGEERLRAYLDRRHAFIRDARDTAARRPLAFYPINFDDWLRNDPTFAAAVLLADGRQPSRAGPKDGAGWREILAASPAAYAGAAAAAAGRDGRTREVLPNGRLEGPVLPGLRIAGLPYGLDLPRPWHSEVEPKEWHEAVLRDLTADGGPARVLRLAGNESTTAFQWVPARAGQVYNASVAVRGRVSSSDAVMLTLGWLDAQQRPVGEVIVMRLPDGSWPGWVRLRQGGLAPATAAWVGVGIRVQHQIADDWIECGDFSLLESAENR